eukprot:1458292-Rhodomonas_salina.2
MPGSTTAPCQYHGPHSTIAPRQYHTPRSTIALCQYHGGYGATRTGARSLPAPHTPWTLVPGSIKGYVSTGHGLGCA